MGLLRFVLLSVLLLTTLVYADQIVRTNSGPVRGKTLLLETSGRVEAYLGIPYAEPPIGQLRFAKPIPKTPWTDIYNATKMSPPCVQLDTGLPGPTMMDLSRMTEDCLTLNVWVPNLKTADDSPKAIMFYIHGGAFMVGTASELPFLDGAKLAQRGDVVVVTINYRVGSLGFLSGGTEDAPGNQGLQDQIQALRWIKDNAVHFGGDPDNIAILGDSAGAFSVSLLQLSPSSIPLFRRAILQSGSAVNSLYTVDNKVANDIDSMYVRELGCATDDITATNISAGDVLNCLKNLPAEDFARADLAAFRSGTTVLFPHFGEELFPNDAVSLFQEGLFKRSEVLMGVTRDEGMVGVFLEDPASCFPAGDSSEEEFCNRTTAYKAIEGSTYSRMILETVPSDEREAIVQSYLYDVCDDSGYTYLKAVSDAWGDCLITCGSVFQAEYQSARGDPVYFYFFDHRTANSPHPEWKGVPHGEELQYVFGNPLYPEFTEEEEQLSQDIMDLWTSFAKTGRPILQEGFLWPVFTPEDPKYLVLDGKDRVVETRPDKHRCERWRNLFTRVRPGNC